MQEILNNLEGMEIDEAAVEVNDAEWPMFMRTDETQEFAPSSEVQAAEIRVIQSWRKSRFFCLRPA